jgi:hypothetical protein
MVPPWVPPAPPPVDPASPDGPPDADDIPNPGPDVTAPDSNRFRGARTNLGQFARGGTANNVRRAVSHYVRTGYGGSGTASSRLANTTRTAGTLYQMLSAYAGNTSAPAGAPSKQALTGRDAKALINAVVEAVAKTTGSLDVEAARKAIESALSEVLEEYPDEDLLNLSDEARERAIECYVAEDVFVHMELDVGDAIWKNADSATEAVEQLDEIREFIRETVFASFDKLHEDGVSINTDNVSNVASKALRDAMVVFEEYIK